MSQKITKAELLSRLTQRAGLRRGDARVMLDALLEVMGEELDQEHHIALPPLGVLKIVHGQDRDGQPKRIYRLVRSNEAAKDTDDGAK